MLLLGQIVVVLFVALCAYLLYKGYRTSWWLDIAWYALITWFFTTIGLLWWQGLFIAILIPLVLGVARTLRTIG